MSTEISKIVEIQEQIDKLANEKATYVNEYRDRALSHILSSDKYKYRSDLTADVGSELASVMIKRAIAEKNLQFKFDDDLLNHSLKTTEGKEIPFRDFINSVLTENKILSPEGLAELPAPTATETPTEELSEHE